jgi:hypothetical protein
MATNSVDRRLALQFVVDKLDPNNTSETILKRANEYAEFLTNGRLPSDGPTKPAEEFDPLSPE